MNRSALCIKMLQLLKAKGCLSREELARQLETNIRNISEFRKELEAAGYYIASTRGKYGGYQLLSDALLPATALHAKEKQSCKELLTYLEAKKDFPMEQEIQSVIGKLLLQTQDASLKNSIYLTQNIPSWSKEIKTMMEQMERAIEQCLCVSLQYRSMKDADAKTVRIQPYEMIYYQGNAYCLAYSLKAKDFRLFKFSKERMQKLSIEKTSFVRDHDFAVNQHIGKSGLVKGELFEVEMRIYGEHAILCTEQQLGLNPKMHWERSDVLYVKTLFENKKECYAQLLALGANVEVLAPQFVKTYLCEEAKKILTRYELER